MHVVDVVAQQQGTFHAHAEGEAGVDLRIEASGLQHIRVDHTAAAPFEPACAALLVREPQVEFGARLGEREVARTQTGLGFRAEHGHGKLIEHALQVGHGQMLVDRKSLHLVEHRRMGGVELIGAEHAARACDVQRHATGEQTTHLIGGGLGAQHHVGSDEARGVLGLIALDVEGILHLTCRMVGAEVQRVEVVPFGFHFRTVGNLPAHGDEKVFDILHQLRQRVARAKRLAVDRKGHIHGFGGKRTGLFLGLDLLFLGAIRTTEVGAQLAHNLAGVFLLVLRQRADGLAGLRDALGNRIGYRLGVEYRTFCHEIPFSFPVCFTRKTRNFNVFRLYILST